MRKGQNNRNNNNRRPRGRGPNNGGNGGGGSSHPHGNRRQQHMPLRHQNFDSNGPDVRIRGNAFQIYDKYQALARDAQASGDRVAYESHMQHAEHYYRIICQINEQEGRNRQHRHDGVAPYGAAYGSTAFEDQGGDGQEAGEALMSGEPNEVALADMEMEAESVVRRDPAPIVL
jgi:Domain of unknown function (DUF4167)